MDVAFGAEPYVVALHIVPLSPESDQEYITRKAGEHGVSAKKILKPIKCESGFRHEGLYGDGGRAYGIAQFHRPTFESFKKKANMPTANYFNKYDQIDLMAWAFKVGYANHWTCFRKI